VTHRGDQRARPDHDVVTYLHRRDVEDGHVVVGDEALSHVDVEAAVAVEPRLEVDVIPVGAEEEPRRLEVLARPGEGLVQPRASHAREVLARLELWVGEAVVQSRLELLQLRHAAFVFHGLRPFRPRRGARLSTRRILPWRKDDCSAAS
jgi:hypothetical protein